ncbi:hypothetical protein [Pedobacter punctiformis]|uniref:Glycerophosphoryl diester phosphodiesterase membrane domain-containing protein n=1 Tax=Pedobacter punctiformis TaxID=3004097 RepID=A0ABT4L695_9SPHI|nr:hypothetical protein [Pedobacter sp. HCMS5-2]MCZ4243447.1 hypothetical protein [Pedobacter sp. HCMS5-2]
MAGKVEFRKIREFGEIIGDTFLFIRQNFKPLGKAFLYLCGIFLIGGVLTTMMAQFKLISASDQVSISPAYRNGYFASVISKFAFHYLLMYAFMLLSYISIHLTVLSYVALYVQKGNTAPNVEEVWSYFKFYFFRMLGNTIVMSLFFIICFVCCIIPGIYVFPAITLFYPVMIIENGALGYSFNRTFKLLKEEWWVTAAVLLVIWIITYACTTFAQLPGIILMMINTFTHAGKPITAAYAIISSICQYIAQIFMVIPIIGATLIYFNLVERKESSGLMDRIDSLGKAADQTNITPEEY